MKNRIELALEACAGLTDAELKERGKGSFNKMINRKRNYAMAARALEATNRVIAAELAETQKREHKAKQELAQALETIAVLEALNAPVLDTTEAGSMLTTILKTPSH